MSKVFFLSLKVPQSSDNAWVEISSWKINRVSGSFSLTKSLSATNGRYSAEVSGIYHVSANLIFNAPASVISLLIAANGDQSKRNALFSTKGNPGSKDFLTVSGSLRLQRGLFAAIPVAILCLFMDHYARFQDFKINFQSVAKYMLNVCFKQLLGNFR